MDRPDSQTAFLQLEKLLKSSRDKSLTLQDASARTGIPLLETRFALQELMKRYDCRLKVTENGDLIYDFEDLHRRDEPTFGERLREWGDWLWAAFQVFYKLLIGVVLVVYFIIFFLLILALIFGANSGSNNNRNSSGDLIFILIRIGIAIFDWQTIRGRHQQYYRQDKDGYVTRHYEEKPSAIRSFFQGDGRPGKENKGFIPSVYDFVFGPPRVPLPDVLANAQELASFLRLNKGLVSIPEIQALTGYTRTQAENFLTRSLANFEGEAKISDNGSLYADFSEFMRRKNRENEAPVIYYWDEFEPEHELTGNTSGNNLIIIGMNLFNMVMAWYVMFMPLGLESGLQIGLGLIPFVYALLFFFIPMVRAFFLMPKKTQRRLNNVRKRLMRTIFQENSAMLSLEHLTELANANSASGKEPPLNPASVEAVMKDLIYDLKGEMFLDDQAKVMYRFEDLDRELNDVEAERRRRPRLNSDLGDIVFDSKD